MQGLQEEKRNSEEDLVTEKKRIASLEMQWEDTKRYLENLM